MKPEKSLRRKAVCLNVTTTTLQIDYPRCNARETDFFPGEAFWKESDLKDSLVLGNISVVFNHVAACLNYHP